MDKALPILKEIIRKQNAGKCMVPPTDEQLASIFNEIDADGNQTLEREELVAFLKRSHFDLETVI